MHSNDLVRMRDGDRQLPGPMPGELRFEHLCLTDEHDLERPSCSTHGRYRTLDLRARSVVSTHRIDCDPHGAAGTSRYLPWRWFRNSETPYSLSLTSGRISRPL